MNATECRKWCRKVRRFNNEFLSPVDLLLDHVYTEDNMLIRRIILEKIVEAWIEAKGYIFEKNEIGNDKLILIPQSVRDYYHTNVEATTVLNEFVSAWSNLEYELATLGEFIEEEHNTHERNDCGVLSPTVFCCTNLSNRAFQLAVSLSAFTACWKMTNDISGFVWAYMVMKADDTQENNTAG